MTPNLRRFLVPVLLLTPAVSHAQDFGPNNTALRNASYFDAHLLLPDSTTAVIATQGVAGAGLSGTASEVLDIDLDYSRASHHPRVVNAVGESAYNYPDINFALLDSQTAGARRDYDLDIYTPTGALATFYVQYVDGAAEGFDAESGHDQTIVQTMHYADIVAARRVRLLGGATYRWTASPQDLHQIGSAFVLPPLSDTTTMRVQTRADAIASLYWYFGVADPTTFTAPIDGAYDIVIVQQNGCAFDSSSDGGECPNRNGVPLGQDASALQDAAGTFLDNSIGLTFTREVSARHRAM